MSVSARYLVVVAGSLRHWITCQICGCSHAASSTYLAGECMAGCPLRDGFDASVGLHQVHAPGISKISSILTGNKRPFFILLSTFLVNKHIDPELKIISYELQIVLT